METGSSSFTQSVMSQSALCFLIVVHLCFVFGPPPQRRALIYDNHSVRKCVYLFNSALSDGEEVSEDNRVKGRSLEQTANEQKTFIPHATIVDFVEEVMLLNRDAGGVPLAAGSEDALSEIKMLLPRCLLPPLLPVPLRWTLHSPQDLQRWGCRPLLTNYTRWRSFLVCTEKVS